MPGEGVNMPGYGSQRVVESDPPPAPAPEVTSSENTLPFAISSTGVINPGLVGGLMPTLNGDPLDDTTETVPTSGTFKVYFTLNFSVYYTEGFLATYTLNFVTVNTAATVPTDTDDTKYLQFNTITSGVPSASFFTSSIGILLGDDGSYSNTLIYYT